MKDKVKAALFRGVGMKAANVWPLYGTGESLDRSAYVTSSEVGNCERQIYFDKRALKASGYSPEKGTASKSTDDWGYFERGHTIEDWVVRTLHRGNTELRIILTGEQQRSFAVGAQSGTPDGVILVADGFYILEIKSFDPRKKVTAFPDPNHVKQVTQNCDLVEATLKKDCYGAVLIYVNASNFKDVHPFDIPFDHDLAQTLQAKAERIMSASSPADLEPEGVHNSGCDYCKHAAACNALIRQPLMQNKETINDLKSTAARLFGQP